MSGTILGSMPYELLRFLNRSFFLRKPCGKKKTNKSDSELKLKKIISNQKYKKLKLKIFQRKVLENPSFDLYTCYTQS